MKSVWFTYLKQDVQTSVAVAHVLQLTEHAWQARCSITYPSAQAEQAEEFMGEVQPTQEGSHLRHPTPPTAISDCLHGTEQVVRERAAVQVFEFDEQKEGQALQELGMK